MFHDVVQSPPVVLFILLLVYDPNFEHSALAISFDTLNILHQDLITSTAASSASVYCLGTRSQLFDIPTRVWDYIHSSSHYRQVVYLSCSKRSSTSSIRPSRWSVRFQSQPTAYSQHSPGLKCFGTLNNYESPIQWFCSPFSRIDGDERTLYRTTSISVFAGSTNKTCIIFLPERSTRLT